MILKYLEEADDLLEKGDVVQACEKYYKAAEDLVKYLSKLNLQRWDSKDLFKQSKKFPCLRDVWRSAWKLHVDCFHNYIMNENEVRIFVKDVKRIEEILHFH
ncbi:PaREP1 family protein [Acidianus sp. HS-5]|uniref:PaREP1 family protein n=1 Tax=Acidianus sp. HS-5 TaxID=2886040 RepID=UPI001F3567C8|nr:PaREP1 family protein [Acidianus sp. HS-5]BDC18008.1 hypothetical protein HS5_08980 [Acidianus sp. HS-5]